MLRTVAEYGLLAAALLLALHVGEYALFLRPSVASWVIGGAAAVVLAVGLLLGRHLVGRDRPKAAAAAGAMPDDARIADVSGRRVAYAANAEVASGQLAARGANAEVAAGRQPTLDANVRVAAGQQAASGLKDAAIESRRQAAGISDREYEVLVLVSEGLSNQEIADRLFIAETTVKSHVSSLLTKLDARRRTEAVNRAQEAGIL